MHAKHYWPGLKAENSYFFDWTACLAQACGKAELSLAAHRETTHYLIISVILETNRGDVTTWHNNYYVSVAIFNLSCWLLDCGGRVRGGDAIVEAKLMPHSFLSLQTCRSSWRRWRGRPSPLRLSPATLSKMLRQRSRTRKVSRAVMCYTVTEVVAL